MATNLSTDSLVGHFGLKIGLILFMSIPRDHITLRLFSYDSSRFIIYYYALRFPSDKSPCDSQVTRHNHLNHIKKERWLIAR